MIVKIEKWLFEYVKYRMDAKPARIAVVIYIRIEVATNYQVYSVLVHIFTILEKVVNRVEQVLRVFLCLWECPNS